MSERKVFRVSDAELERRWALIRRAMAREGLDCLIINNYDNYLGGYSRYFTDVSVGKYPNTVLFHRDDRMTYIGHNGTDMPSLPAYMARGVGEALSTPFMPTMHYTNDYVPKLVAENLQRRGYRSVGLVGMSMMPASQYRSLTERLPQVQFRDATELVDRIKAVKSAEELTFLREVVDIHDKVAAAAADFVRPGRKEYEIYADISKLALDFGCECLNINLGLSAGKPMMVAFPAARNRTAMPGDTMMTLIELNGPGGYYGELMRMYSVGEPNPLVVQATAHAMECEDLVAGLMRPGADCGELFRANNEFLTARGYAPEGRLFGHGQGYDMVERPSFVPAETMRLEENMFVAMHPFAGNAETLGLTCSNYIITADGAQRLNKAPRGVIVCQ